jgi:hypothetical protein
MGVTIPAGSTYAQTPLTVVGAGRTQIGAMLDDSTAQSWLTSVAVAQLSNLSIPDPLQVGQASQVSVSLNVAAAVPHTVMLTSSDPTVVTLPDHVTIMPGSSSATAHISVLKAANAVVTATLDGISQQALAHATTSMPQLYLSAPQHVAVGAFAQLSVSNGSSASGIVQLTSSDPTILSVPASVPIAYSDTVTMKPLKSGMVTLTASFDGAMATTDVTVVDTAEISYFGPQFNIPIGAGGGGYLQLSAIAPLGTQVTFTSSDSTVVAAPSPITFSGGSTGVSFPLYGLTSGTVTLTATVGTTSKSAVVFVGSNTSGLPAYLSYAYPYASKIQVGAATIAQVGLYGMPAATDLVAMVSFTTPGILSTPDAMLTFPAGQTYSSVLLQAMAAGTTDVVIKLGTQTTSFTVNVVATPGFSLYVPSSIKAGTLAVATISTDTLLRANTIFMVGSQNTGIVTTTATTVTLQPGQQGAGVQFGVNGVAAGGPVNITASGGGANLTAGVTVTP